MSYIVPRDFVEPPDVAAIHDKYRKSLPRFGDAYDALEWLLVRAPDRTGADMGHPGWRVHV